MTPTERAAVVAETEAAIVAWLREEAQAEHQRALDNKGTKLGPCAGYASLALKQSANAIERGEYRGVK